MATVAHSFLHLSGCNVRNIALFEVDAVDVDRFFVVPLGLSDEVKLVLVDEPSEYQRYQKEGMLRGDRVTESAWMKISEVRDLLVAREIDVLLLDASRIVDMYVAAAARDAGVTISYIQHGMYIPFMRRSFGFFVGKATKSIRYMTYAWRLARWLKNIRIFLRLFAIHVLGNSRHPLRDYTDIFPDRGAVFSAYWRDWHVLHYAFDGDTLTSIGTPDLAKHKFGNALPNDHVAYCYQTLVEDGRISKEIMYAAYRQLAHWSETNRRVIVVKTHPRGSREHFGFLQSLGFVLETDVIPNTEMVIGHYSSLLAFWGLAGRRVVASRLPEHDVHESIAPWAEVVDRLDYIPLAGSKVDIVKCQYFFDQLVSKETIRQLLHIE